MVEFIKSKVLSALGMSEAADVEALKSQIDSLEDQIIYTFIFQINTSSINICKQIFIFKLSLININVTKS